LARYVVIGNLVKGLADARNHAIEEASGKYVVCVDADDWVEPEFIERMLEASPEDQEYSLVTCSMNEFGDRTSKRAIGLAGRPVEAELQANYFLVCSMYTRSLHKLVGGYENSLFGYEDWDFWVKLCQVPGIYLGEVPEYLFNYRIHGDQGSNFCEQNDGALRAAMHLIHPDIYGPPAANDMMALVKCSEAARQKFLQRTAWFPDDRNAQLIGKFLADKIRDVFVSRSVVGGTEV
jgi:glycosyltransferase involved in cell wall biosynthesis